MAELMVKKEKGSDAIEAAELPDLGSLSKIAAQSVRPSGGGAGKHVAEPKASLAQSRKGKPAGESSELYIGDSRIALLEAAGNRHSGNAAHAGGTAEFFFFDGGYDGSVIHQNGRGVSAKGPDAKGKHRLSVPRFPKAGARKRVRNRAQRHIRLRKSLHRR